MFPFIRRARRERLGHSGGHTEALSDPVFAEKQAARRLANFIDDELHAQHVARALERELATVEETEQRLRLSHRTTTTRAT